LEITIPYPGNNQDNVAGSLPITTSKTYSDVSSSSDISEWLDTDYLETHGITVFQDDDGTDNTTSDDSLKALIPLVDVLDTVGDTPVAWAATMLYQPQTSAWGAEHEVRLVWYLSGYNDYCNSNCDDDENWQTYPDPTIFVDYEDQFTVTSLNVTEYESVQTAAIVQTDALNPSAGYEEDLWRLGDGLMQTFAVGGLITTTDRYDIEDVKATFDNDTNTPLYTDGADELMGISNGKIEMLLSSSDDVILGLEQTMSDRDTLLETQFSSQAAISDTVTVLFLREEAARTSGFSSASISDSSITIDMTDEFDTVTAVMNWASFDYAGDSAETEWVETDLTDYRLNELEPAFRDLTDQAYFDILNKENEVITNFDSVKTSYSIVAFEFYMMLLNGVSGVVELDDQFVIDSSEADFEISFSEILLISDVPAFLSIADEMLFIVSAYLNFYADVELDAETFANTDLGEFDKIELAEAIAAEDRLEALTDPNYLADGKVKANAGDFIIDRIQTLFIDIGPFNAKNKFFDLAAEPGGDTYKTSKFAGKAAKYRTGLFIGAFALSTSLRFIGPAIGLPPLATVALTFTIDFTAITFSAVNMVESIKDYYKLTKIYEQVKTIQQIDRVNGVLRGTQKSLKMGAVAGFVLSVGLIIGVFIYTVVSEKIKPGIQLNALVTRATIQIAVQVILLVIGLFFPVGTIIVLVISILDLMAFATCEVIEALVGEDGLSPELRRWACGGITGALTEALTYAIHDTWVSVDTSKEDRLSIEPLAPAILTEGGFKAGTEVELGYTVVTTITKNPPDEGVIKNSQNKKSFNLTDFMRKSSFDYVLQDEEKDLHDELGFSETDWDDNNSATFTPTYSIIFDTARNNQLTPDLFLTESYNILHLECWGFVGATQGTCKEHSIKGSSHIPIDSYTFDIFPATIGDFFDATTCELRWVQSGIVSPLQDVDGDGLTHDCFTSQTEPWPNSPDGDNDGLSDAWELENGTDVYEADRDGDGLSDYWEIFYGTSPYRSDSDGDGLLDGEEFFHSPTAYPWEAEDTDTEWTGGWTIVYDLDESGNEKNTLVSADPTLADTDSDGLLDGDERFFDYHPRVSSRLNPLSIDGEIETISDQAGIVGLDDSVTFTATVENQDAFLQTVTATLEVEIPTGSLQSTESIGLLEYGERASVSNTANIGQVGATAYTSVTLRAEGLFVDDQNNAPSNITQTPLVNLPFNEPQNAGTFENFGSLGGEAFCDLSVGDSNVEGCPYTGVDGKNGNAVLLYAGNDRITYTNPSLVSQSYTVGFWFNHLTHSRNAAAFQWGDQQIELSGLGGNSITYRFAEKSGDSCETDAANELITFDGIFDERWSHVVVTHDYDDATSTSTISLYVDGVLADTVSDTTEGACQTGMENLGLYGGFSANSVIARIDDVYVYDEALSPTDVSTFYTYQFSQFDSTKQIPITIDATGPETFLAASNDIMNETTQLAVSAIDDLSLVSSVTVSITSPTNASEVIVPTQTEINGALWYFWFQPTVEGEYLFTIESTDSVNNSSIHTDTIFVDDSPAIAVVDDPFETTIRTTSPEDIRRPNVLTFTGTITDNRVLGERIEVDLLDWQAQSVKQSEAYSITRNGRDSSLGRWEVDYRLDGPIYGGYDILATTIDEVGNELTGTIGTIDVDDFGPWADITISEDYISKTTIFGTVSDLRYDLLNRVVHYHFEEPAGSTTFVDGSRYQSQATCSGASCPTAGQTGLYGSAVEFDGVDDSLAVIDRTHTITSGATAMAWVQPTWSAGSQGYDPVLLEVKDGDAGYRWEIADDYGSMSLSTVTETQSIGISLDPNGSHLAVTINQDGTWTGYVDGVAAGTMTQTFGTTNGLSITIGSAYDGSNSFAGLLDEVMLYDYPITADIIYNFANPLATEVTEVEYQTRAVNGAVWPGVDPDGLQLYLPLNDPRGTTEVEFSSYTITDTTAAATCDRAFVITDDEVYAASGYSDDQWLSVYGYPVSDIATNNITYTVDTCPIGGSEGVYDTGFRMDVAQTITMSGTQDLDLVDMTVALWFRSSIVDQNFNFF
ncbi:MAG: LamG-like jellyroll fold domain-containing protein, partial [Chloroflexota bacterium]